MNSEDEQKNAIIENLREGIADAITMLEGSLTPSASSPAIELLQGILGMDGEEHLKALREHERLVMALLAFRVHALEQALPDTCPKCGQTGRIHDPQCLFGLALTLIPDHMPPIEASAVRRLAACKDQLATWADELDALTGNAGDVRCITDAMRDVHVEA